MYSKVVVCLANSRKPPSGRCVAGREFESGALGAWIRPVSARSSREVSEEERQYSDGQDPQVLDILSIPFTAPVPHLHQQENHEIDAGYYWDKEGTISWRALARAVEDPAGPLWLNDPASFNGQNDRVSVNHLGTIDRSLYLIRPTALTIHVAPEGPNLNQQRRKVRAQFECSGHDYRFAVTDPWFERQYLPKPDGKYPIADAILCVSLGEPFNGFAYKLVASVITRQRADG